MKFVGLGVLGIDQVIASERFCDRSRRGRSGGQKFRRWRVGPLPTELQHIGAHAVEVIRIAVVVGVVGPCVLGVIAICRRSRLPQRNVVSRHEAFVRILLRRLLRGQKLAYEIAVPYEQDVSF